MQKNIVILLLLLAALRMPCFAADNADIGKVLELMKTVRSMSVYAYRYEVRNSYPGNQAQSVSGEACIDLPKKMLYEKGTYSTTVLNDKWYYKAEHEQKLVTVMYLPKQGQDKQQAELSGALSGSAFLPDSIIRRYGQVLAFSVEHNIVTLKMRFRNMPSLDRYELVFDLVKKLPVSIFFRTSYSSFSGTTVQEVRCTRFHKEIPAGCFSVQPWFEIRSGSVVLKQYKNYKRHIEL